MREETGDLWQLSADARCITTNGAITTRGACVMGRGCAAEAKDRFRGIEYDLGRLIRTNGNHVHELRTGLLSFPVKHHWREQADLELIARSAQELVALAELHPEWKRLLLPRPGCGNGRLQWESVSIVLTQVLTDDRFVIVTK